MTLPNMKNLLQRLESGEVLDVFLELHEQGLDVNTATNKFGQTLLAYTLNLGDVDITKTLLDAGADSDAPSKSGKIPLMHATRNIALTELLLSYGANPNKKCKQGNIAVRLAILRNHLDVALLLIPLVEDIDARYGPQGHTLLHDSVLLGHQSIVDALLDHGASADITDNRGRRALDYTTTKIA